MSVDLRRRGRGAGAFGSPQRDDLRRRGIEAEIELQLPLTRGNQSADNVAECHTLGQTVVRLFDDRQIGKREERVRVGARHRPENAAFHEIAHAILAERAVPRHHVTH